jgi:hypothetical protein
VTVPASLPESLISLQFRLGRWGWPIHAGAVGLTGFARMAEPIGAPAPARPRSAMLSPMTRSFEPRKWVYFR